jgi:dihydroorotate dehydrogenase
MHGSFERGALIFSLFILPFPTMSYSLYKSVVSPLLDRFDSESMEHRAREALRFSEYFPAVMRLGLGVVSGFPVRDPRLETNLAGVRLQNPVMLAAGWDKAGRAVRALHAMGFGGVEVGTVVQNPQPGNPRPRQWVIAPGVAINALGFNSPGMAAVAKNLERYRHDPVVLGMNLGKNREVSEKDAPNDYAAVAKELYRFADYFTVNVSSPNTPGLRKLQDRGVLTEIIQAVLAAEDACGARKPLFIKIAPELETDAVDDVVDVALSLGITGIITANTTNRGEIKARYGERWREVAGGLSGDDAEYRSLALAQVAHIYRTTQGKLTLIGVGGIKDGPTAIARLRAGASALQLLTALRGEGPRVVNTINRGILAWMEQHGVKSVSEIVGLDHR